MDQKKKMQSNPNLPNLNLMARRLGLVYKNASVNQNVIRNDDIVDNNNQLLAIDSIENQAVQFEYNGGRIQQERMIADKRRSLDRALLYSYQGADISKVSADDEQIVRALMNPNKVKQDYDEKIVSVGYEYGYKPGDVFQWVGTNTYWLIYLQELTELAYFRGNCRRCSYRISYPGVDEEGNIIAKEMYAAIEGPPQVSIQTAKHKNISMDVENNTIQLLVPKNEATLAFFDRRIKNNGEVYDKFCIRSIDENMRWEAFHVEAANWISTPGAIEVTALQVPYNENEFSEQGLWMPDFSDQIDKDVEINEPEVEEQIAGDTFIKPTITYEYKYMGENPNGTFIIGGKKAPVHVIEQDNTHIKLKWTHTYSGQFELIYRVSVEDVMTGAKEFKDITKTVVAESLF